MPQQYNTDKKSKKHRLSILIAEPEEDIQIFYKSFLTDWQATVVDTGEKCLDFMSRTDRAFDMVIIGSHIKGIDVIETIRRIRRIAPDQHIVITSTNLNQLGRKIEAAGIEKDERRIGLIDLVQKPFSFTQILSLIRSRVPRVNKIGLADHVLAIYEDADEELLEAIAFLKRSIQNNEVGLLLTRKNNEHDIEALKSKIRARGIINVDQLISDGSIIIMHNEDWYIPDQQADKHRIIRQWNELVDHCKSAGKNGLRAFCRMDCFFEHNFSEEVVDYEHTLPVRFTMPFVPVCAYRKEDIDRLSEDQKRRLIVCHSHVWTSDKIPSCC
jgi:DNA-binding response OmpR family regulator